MRKSQTAENLFLNLNKDSRKFSPPAISFIMILNFALIANADKSPSLKFNESGKFRIILINDTHGNAASDERLISKHYKKK